VTDAAERRFAARPRIEPRPLPRPGRVRAAGRAGKVASTFGRRFATLPLRAARAGRGADRRDLLGPPLRRAAEDLGPTFVKLGQLLASSPSIAGPALADQLRGLLDDGPGIELAAIRRIVEEDTGRRFGEVFARFDPTPHAAASLAVVHRATLHDGTRVAVKVLRPGTERLIADDLAVVRPLFAFLAEQAPVGIVSSLPGTVEGLAEQLAEELDLRNEARSMDWFRSMLELIGAEGVIVPRSFPEASGRRVLTMEFHEGRPVDDLESVEAVGFDAAQAVQRLLHAWFAVALCTGAFHGDMHAGNLLFTDDGQVVLLDWGIVGRLDPASRRFLRRSIEGALGDERAWDDVRAHIMPTVGAEMARLTGMSEDDVFELVKAQIGMIMTQPFHSLDLMALVPQSPASAGALGGAGVGDGAGPPTSTLGWLRLIRSERRRLRRPDAEPPPVPDRGEMLLVKQLLYFERYGKLYLGDRPLIWDPDVYRALLALPEDHEDPCPTSTPS
jgi:hypothetical protein